MDPTIRERRPALKLGLLLAATCMILGLLGETFVKLYYFGWYDAPKQLLVPSDSPILVYELRPGARITTTYLNPEQREWKYSASVNFQGFRGEPVGLEARKPRIIVLGDSYVFGYGVNDDQTFSHVLQNRLRDEVEVMNWGGPGYNLVQAIELLKSKGQEYRPELVILALHYNDFEPPALQSARQVQHVLWSHMYSVYRHIQFLGGEDIEVRLARSREQRTEQGFKAFDEFVRLAQKWNFEPVLFRSSCPGGHDQQEIERLLVHSRSSSVQTIDANLEFCQRPYGNRIPHDGHPTP